MTREERIAEYRRKHFGECAVANCGMKMFIIAYRNNDDIDVVFQDGTIVKNKRYKNFTKGKIANPNIGLGLKVSDRVGETSIAKNMQNMIIINYRTFYDIDIQFEDGTIVNNIDCKNFKNGYVKNPNFFKNRIGETRLAVNGLKMTIVAYHSSSNIDIQFEDGEIVKHKRYDHFLAGKIKHPQINPLKKDGRVGEVSQSASGQKMTIISYRATSDIDVKFEDGTVVKHKTYAAFLQGQILKSNVSKRDTLISKGYFQDRTNEESISSLGQKMIIIKYRNTDDIDVQFEDGTIVKHKTYYNFKHGNIVNPHYKNAKHTSVNESAILFYLKKYGFIKAESGSLRNMGFGKMELDCYHPILKIAIEYDGFWHKPENDKRKNKACEKAGIVLIRIRESVAYKMFDNNSKNFYLTDDKQLSDNFNKVLIEVCSYINNISSLNIDITEINFKKDFDAIYAQSPLFNLKFKIGDIKYANNGQKMKLLVYRNSHDIDVEFEDSTIVQHKKAEKFESGNIKNPNFYKTKIGETSISNNGQKMTIIAWRRSDDIDVQFEDGAIVYNKHYHAFKNGQIKNPNTKRFRGIKTNRIGEQSISTQGQVMTIIAYRGVKEVDVQFEDGTIVLCKDYNAFITGKIKNPNMPSHKKKKDRLGEIQLMKNNQYAKIIVYKNVDDISIQFDDGRIYEHVSYKTFQKGGIPKLNKLKKTS